MIIYKATSPSGKIYIGLTTTSLEVRIKNHLRTSRKSQNLIHKAIRKYGIDNFKWEIIDSAQSMLDLYEKEKYWIEFYNSYKTGYNLTMGGEGVVGIKISDDTKEYLRNLGKSQWQNMSEEEKLKRIKNNLNFKGNNKKSIIDSNGKKFDSLELACKFYKMCHRSILASIKEKRQVKGLSFKYYQDGDLICPEYPKVPRKKSKPRSETFKQNWKENHPLNKHIVDSNGIKYFSISDAARKLNASRDTIRKCLVKNVEHQGLRFYYG